MARALRRPQRMRRASIRPSFRSRNRAKVATATRSRCTCCGGYYERLGGHRDNAMWTTKDAKSAKTMHDTARIRVTIRGNGGPAHGNKVMVHRNRVTVCGNEVTVCGNEVTVCGNRLTVCGNRVTEHRNEGAVCGNGVTAHWNGVTVQGTAVSGSLAATLRQMPPVFAATFS